MPSLAGLRRDGRSVVWIVALAVVCVGAVIWWLWRAQTTTWPPELEPPRSQVLFSDAERPTADDLALLDEMVSGIAARDPVIVDLLGGQPWPDPEIAPVYWIHTGSDNRSALIGGSFRLDLDQVTYRGPWPSAGCRDGSYRGTVRSIDAVGLTDVVVVIDLTFERATSLSIPPPGPPTDQSTPLPVIRYGADLEDAPWYTGRCRRFTFGG